ncbi:DEAD/DEAH box helicase [Ignicoccus pacificus DSM 13166]|uniref:DEAD/DEAH box helicase n=1 Tax=Ignicoccus pacificus DSM 13166 TaxID=940294 RepID=A0A977PKT6_9CREN|nr:DEAD/DEAH box helicase [Ignicoccus pacificus DSM 13166]
MLPLLNAEKGNSVLKVKLREYQKRALEIALTKKRAVIVMPTGSGKTIVAGAWLEELKRRGELGKALVLEPTRILVDQNSLVLSEKFEVEAKPLHGGKSETEKRSALKAEVVVATPEEAVNFPDLLKEVNVLVVDECHHTTGKDAYVKVVELVKAEWRLGLSAFIPPNRKEMIEKYIGEIIVWTYENEEILRYMPKWIGEVYESPLCKECMEYYQKLKEMWASSAGRIRGLYALAMRFLARDGALALAESAKKGTLLSHLLREIEGLEKCTRSCPVHKLPHLERVLNDHPFEKAIVFIDRVVVARFVAEKLGAALVVGKRSGKVKLEEVKKASIIVSTSAGEEGIDLPEADLLVIWSNTSSTLRLIQRIGRLLRPKQGKMKFLVFIATPETVDMDLLIEGLEMAKRVGVDAHVDVKVLRRLLRKSTAGSVMEALKGRPLYEEFIAELAAIPLTRLKRILNRLGKEGIAAYLYGPAGKLWFLQEDAHLVWSELEDYLTPCPGAWVHVKETGNKGLPGRVAEELGKRVPVGPLTVKVRARLEGMEIFDVRKYNFLISEPEVAKLVVFNASSRGLLGC